MADVRRAATTLDTLVQEYLEPHADPAAADALGALICCQTDPIIRSIVGYRLGGSGETAQDIDDVCSEVMLALLGRLDDLRAQEAGFAGDFSGYVAVSSYNACSSYFRHRFPERERVKNRLRSLLKPARGWDLWQREDGIWLCGFATWREAHPDGGLVHPDRWSQDLPASPEQALDLLATVFDRAGTPVRFDDLVDVATELWETETRTPAAHAEPASPVNVEAEFASAATVARIWQEVIALPLPQRHALLLNLRGATDGCPIALFPLMGVATLRQIALALEIPIDEFAGLWNDLPLDDTAIAQRLGVTRQQVINLRKSARKRLERRMVLE